MRILSLRLAFAGLVAAAGTACAAPATSTSCTPTLQAPWIRAALPGSTMLAGYVVVRNDCPAPVAIIGADSPDFSSVTIHQTVDEGGISRMREAGRIEVAPHATRGLAPGGSHLMLTGPAKALPEGARATVRLVLADGRKISAQFEVRRDAPPQR
jgi:copper(I)-binding protein